MMRFSTVLAAGLLLACTAKSDTTAPTPTPTAPTPPVGATALVVTSSDAASATLPITYTCDGESKSPPLSWTAGPTGTTGYALMMTTIPAPGSVKYNWLLYNIPATTTSIAAGGTAGTNGFADDGAGLSYASPCSQGPGLKQYIFTVYALSAEPNLAGLAANQVNGAALTAAIASVTKASGALSLGVNRTVAMINCAAIRSSINGYRTANSLDMTCDSTYAYFSTFGIQSKHPMMNGITATNQQVPVAQNFTGAKRCMRSGAGLPSPWITTTR